MAPFWSPDSRQIGFFAGGKLKKMSVSGGLPVVIYATSRVSTRRRGARGAPSSSRERAAVVGERC